MMENVEVGRPNIVVLGLLVVKKRSKLLQIRRKLNEIYRYG